MSDIKQLINEIAEFSDKRDWRKFHTPKNLALALAGECGELASEFQWLSPEEALAENLSEEKLHDISMEIADVAIYLFRLTEVLRIDITKVVKEKLSINELRFPVN